MRAIPAMGPLWDRSGPVHARNWRSNRDAASCCQPRLAPGSNSSASWVGSRHSQDRPTWVVRNPRPQSTLSLPWMLHAKKDTRRPRSADAPFPEPLLGVSSESWRDGRPNLFRRPAHWCGKHPEDPDLPWTEVVTQWSSQLDLLPLKLGESVPNTSRDPRCGPPRNVEPIQV